MGGITGPHQWEGLVKIAAFPFIRSKDSIEVAWLTHSHVCTPFSSLPLLRIITLYQGVRQSCHLEEDAITCGAILHMILCKKPCFPRVGVFHRKLKSSQSQQSQARGRHSVPQRWEKASPSNCLSSHCPVMYFTRTTEAWSGIESQSCMALHQ